MNEDESDNFSKNSLAVVAGVMTAILAGVLLLLIMRPLYFRHEYDESKESMMFHVSFFSWFFLSSLAGGFVCTLLSANRNIIHVLTCSLVSLALIFFITHGMIIRPVTLSSLLVLLGIVLGNVAGVGIGVRFKKKNEDQTPR